MKTDIYNKYCLIHNNTHNYTVAYGSCMEQGWSVGAMVLGKLPVPGRPTNVENNKAIGPTMLSVGTCWGCLDIFIFLFSIISYSFSFSGRRPDID